MLWRISPGGFELRMRAPSRKRMSISLVSNGSSCSIVVVVRSDDRLAFISCRPTEADSDLDAVSASRLGVGFIGDGEIAWPRAVLQNKSTETVEKNKNVDI